MHRVWRIIASFNILMAAVIAIPAIITVMGFIVTTRGLGKNGSDLAKALSQFYVNISTIEIALSLIIFVISLIGTYLLFKKKDFGKVFSVFSLVFFTIQFIDAWKIWQNVAIALFLVVIIYFILGKAKAFRIQNG